MVHARINETGKSIIPAAVYSSAGARVIQQQFASSQQLVSIDIATLPPGVYLIRFETSGGMTDVKFVK